METENKKKNFLKEHKMSIFVIVSVVVMLIGLSYAWLQLTLRGTKELTLIAAGTLYLELDDTMEGGISITSAIPISDEEGKSQAGYTFTLENKGQVASDYTIYLDDLDLTEGQIRMPDSAIKYQLSRDGEEIGFGLLNTTGENPNRILDTGTIAKNKKYTYVLKMWIDESAGNEVMGTVFKGQLRIEAIQSMKKSASEELLEKTNPIDLTYDAATEEQKKEMFTFTHTAGTQQAGWSEEELTDYRYIGTTPNNYVTFNNETWRIIGVFTVEDENGNKEKRLKLIRNEPIGSYSFDNKPSGTGSSESEFGSSYWGDSKLKDVLNSGPYYNRTSGECPDVKNNTACDFSSNGLTTDAKSMIGKAKWYLGGWNSSSQRGNQFYIFERGITVYGERETSWVGEVGLMYPSDYGYAASHSSCLNTSLDQYNLSCINTDWLYNSSNKQWTIAPYSEIAGGYAFRVDMSGNVKSLNVSGINGVSPTLYLKSNVTIASGDGSSENPYQLKIG